MVFEDVVITAFAYLIAAGIAGTVSFCTLVYRCVHKQAQRGYRQSQAILLMTKSIEEQTRREHKDYDGDIYSQVEITLKDEEGNL